MKGYPGSKGGSGVSQKIISLMPAHDLYVEAFLGSGVILRTKRPAPSSIAADVDSDVVAWHKRHRLPGVRYRVADAFALLLRREMSEPRTLVYLDPPYHPDTRSRRKIYRHELGAAGHSSLLALARSLRCLVMISGYRHEEYDRRLTGWHREDFKAMTRGGPRVESVWCNFRPGVSYHDTRFLGRDFRERERIKRKRIRWTTRLATMRPLDRAVIGEALELVLRGASPAASPEEAMRP